MADKKTTENVLQEPKFKLSKFRDNARALFNISSSTFDGATSELDTEKEYSKSEVKKVIDTWLKKPIEKKEVRK